MATAGKSFVSKCSTKVSAFDTALCNWIPCADIDDKGRASFGSALLNKKIYIAGGTDGDGVTANANVYDTVSNEWSKVAAMPVGRVHFQMSVLGGKLWAVGGKTASGIADSVASYDPQTDSWSSCSGLSPARVNTAQASAGQFIFVFGGSLADETVVDSIDKFDASTQTWSKVQALPFKRKQIMAGAAVPC